MFGKILNRTLIFFLTIVNAIYSSRQTHHVYSPLQPRGNNCFHVFSTWNTRGVLLELLLEANLIKINGTFFSVLSHI